MELNLTFEINIHSYKLYNGYRSFYATVRLLGKRLWVMRWDTARAPANRLKTKDGLMGWSWGIAS